MHDNLEESMMSSEEAVQHVDTIVIGGGQAGLAAGYHLAKRAVPFLILDANQRIGDAWRNRWDSLRLFTPARYNALPGFRFPSQGKMRWQTTSNRTPSTSVCPSKPEYE